MVNILFFILICACAWIAWKVHRQEKIIPFSTNGKKEEKESVRNINKKTVRNFIGIHDIKMDMIQLNKNEYVMALKCGTVNYDLRNNLEQEGIDTRFEQWLVSKDYPTVWHLQSRYLDLKHQVDEYTANIEKDKNLNEISKQYCYMTLEYMNSWLLMQPRFEIVRYILFPYKIQKLSGKKINNQERAFRELYRRVTSTQNYLEGCGVESEICSTEMLAEMLYYSLNRKRASKARFEDVKLNEMLALYCTSPQDSIRIQKVLQEIKEEKEAEECVGQAV
ncbi:hypothetical protein O0550_13320 [Brevibacillus halotolerans]|uniref:hypothetical protein n=1 Tax=Brevibacillus TaxID=55080 RepID=UPI00215CC908|nr:MULTISPECIES: hypothetical protein [Brevibacillus]MCR8964176.1 hypothetical protein [Brevibacillus laterosporus]MCZ0836331.1 hypothetical protein [Brevibacillus halotolerans]